MYIELDTENIEPKTIMVEGPERAGKSTLISSLYMSRGFKDMIFDRAHLTAAVYDGFKEDRLRLISDILSLDHTQLIILLTDYEHHKERAIATGHPVSTEYEFKRTKDLFIEYGGILQQKFPSKVSFIDGTQSEYDVLMNCLDITGALNND